MLSVAKHLLLAGRIWKILRKEVQMTNLLIKVYHHAIGCGRCQFLAQTAASGYTNAKWARISLNSCGKYALAFSTIEAGMAL